ncbi:hypothetical protein [Shewanella algae]|uniref:hypothetical protein n=1 Tax=Shewanella algae TaxID=38313 RepID=UPI00131FC39C|nr:hypothetical protein [Shewanella algae]QHD55520.1 hypothetical protein GM320_21735 [Shewanella algae]
MPKFNQLISLLFKKQPNWLGKKLPELEQKIARRARNCPISQAYLKNLFFAALWWLRLTVAIPHLPGTGMCTEYPAQGPGLICRIISEIESPAEES